MSEYGVQLARSLPYSTMEGRKSDILLVKGTSAFRIQKR
jgi:hypothetical protein